jgi:predicted RNA binding protein YcfA (HicA-like mRNA interferase family)
MTSRLPRVSGKEVMTALQRAGFVMVRKDGSHRFYSHPDDPTRWATVAYHGKQVLSKRVLANNLGLFLGIKKRRLNRR